MARKKAKPKKPKNGALKYIDDVMKGRIFTCKWVRLCVERHVKDLKDGKKRGIYFDENAGQHAIDFFKYLKHSKGEWAGQIFKLSPWQEFIVWCLFGWMRGDGFRRFRTAFLEIARKNGKTTLISAVGLYLFCADGEAGAEIYSAATKREQAIISHSEATRMVRSSPDLQRAANIGIFRNNLHIEGTASKFEPLGRDSDSMDGLNIHGALIDELHAHKTRDTWDVLETATGSRRQPLQIAITTSGVDRNSICWEQHEYIEKILSGTVEDDTYFGIIYTIDQEEKVGEKVIVKGDKWNNEQCWIKANPNLGVSVKLDDLQRKAKKAKEIPASLNSFLRKHLDVWTQQTSKFITTELWQANFVRVLELDRMRGRTGYGGLDLSSVSDITAWVIVFPDLEDLEYLDVLCRFWCPEARLYDEENRYRNQYQAWSRDGYLTTTDGDAIDYQFIKAQILEDAGTFAINSSNVDRLFQGYQIAMELEQEGMTIVPMGMGYISMGPPMRELEARLIKKKVNHGNNPVLSWMMDNIAISEDPAGNKKPNKADSQGKIDGIVALVMALDRAMRNVKKTSVYEEKGIKTI